MTGGTIQAEVPTGSTVKKAFLYGTYFGGTNPSDLQRTIAFDGTTIVTAKIGDDGSNLATARADVTAQVAAKVGSGGGTTNFEVESDPSGLDGVGLVVISLPTQHSRRGRSQSSTAALTRGARRRRSRTRRRSTRRSPGFSATMSLGVGFGFQGGDPETAGTSTCGTALPARRPWSM